MFGMYFRLNTIISNKNYIEGHNRVYKLIDFITFIYSNKISPLIKINFH